VRIGLFSDIHGNVVALEAVLEDIESKGVDALVCAGDLVAFGPRPQEVLARLSGIRQLMMVRGNTERWLGIIAKTPDGPFEEPIVGKVAPALLWTAERLGEEAVSGLVALPEAGTLEVSSAVVEVEHGSPGSDWHGMAPDMDDEKLASLLGELEATTFCCGHTHKPFVRQIGPRFVVNGGSVGFPYDGTPTSSWALLDIAEDGKVEVTIHRVSSDRDAVARDMAELKMPWADKMTLRLETAAM